MNTQPFSEEDELAIKLRIRELWRTTFILLGIGVLIALALAWARTMKHYSFREDILGLLAFTEVVILGTMSVPLVRHYLDRFGRKKLCAEFTVNKKNLLHARGKTPYLLIIGEGKEIRISRKLYQALIPGDTVYFEIAARSKMILQARRNGRSILEQR